MNKLTNLSYVVILLVAGSLTTTTLFAQDRGVMEQQDTEFTELIDRIDNLMERAMVLAREDEGQQQQDRFRQQTDEESEEGQVGVPTRRSQDKAEDKDKKHVKRMAEHLGMTLANLKNTAERGEMMMQEDQAAQDFGAPYQDELEEEVEQTEEEAEQQDVIGDQQRDREAMDRDRELRRENLGQIREHLTMMTDEIEKTIDVMEKMSKPGDHMQQRPDTQYEDDIEK